VVCSKRVLCTHFSRKDILSSQLAGGGLHTLTRHLLAQLLPLQEPCTVNMASNEGYLFEFG
jgi:hypothetical protein